MWYDNQHKMNIRYDMTMNMNHMQFLKQIRELGLSADN